jgi:DNA polymerase-1
LTGYGGGPLGLQTSLAQGGVYLELEECEDIIETFFDAYPALRRHIGLYKDFILKNGVAVSIFGRVRIFEEVFGDDREAKAKALRAGYNHLIQSTASDMMLVCLTVIERLMRDANLESMLVSTVHDSLVVDAKRSELPIVHEICDQVINNIPDVLKLFFGADYDDSWIIAPISGDFEVGKDYLNQVKVSGANPDWDALLSPKKAA